MESSSGKGTINPKECKLAELKMKVGKKLAELVKKLKEKLAKAFEPDMTKDYELEKAVMEGMGLGDYCLTR